MKGLSDSLSRLLYQIDWGSSLFGESVLKAELKKQLYKVHYVDDKNQVYYYFESTNVEPKDIGYFASDGRKTYRFIYGEVKMTQETDNRPARVTYYAENNFPPFAKLVIDYLLGKYSIIDGFLYDVSNRQFRLLDEYALQTKYGFKDANHIIEILSGIHHYLNVKPVNYIQLYQIAGQDFIIDLELNELLHEPPKQNVSYFKHYPVKLSNAYDSQKIAQEFLEYVIADHQSLHNAQLQAYYMAQVACGIRPKTNFFISKSGVRTGKGLRHIALSGLFKKIDVELDTLKSNGFEALQAWSMFSGGEMALATEQGDIQGLAMERVLKIIATEKTHVARSIGQNQSLVNLSSVLCIDTNRTVALSDEMNGRKILIQYQDRPEGETDFEREEIFAKYWRAFTNRDKSPKIEGSLGFLLNSMEYFKQQGEMYLWKNVEVINDIDLDDFQVALINSLQEVDFVQRTGNKEVVDLSVAVYRGNNAKLSNALSEIGVKATSKKINGKAVRGYVVENQERFDKFVI
ncbi:phage resistance protein [Streptococcus sp. zg-86]|uniref:Phage resistance protein n=1 Tax=Streptococcus zhangguiae TaxID=2664091 RepID=A0A6I4R988_9STRE|nr:MULTISPECIES: phage resistance protein [unclassified Streptococcus]MTB64101.1 phage resistance protein [Streptococcus sp. zg-86]MTB90573.1 phage resistance protein [Streptococcus sp. zg-36]MWV56089.1 phage resistance protein [Streptococcus sp. zg-70]QTH48282.1 phage resistance protein [Streptococcus sp. zg-86]